MPPTVLPSSAQIRYGRGPFMKTINASTIQSSTHGTLSLFPVLSLRRIPKRAKIRRTGKPWIDVPFAFTESFTRDRHAPWLPLVALLAKLIPDGSSNSVPRRHCAEPSIASCTWPYHFG
ncbi:MAG: hypothetical protein IPP19_05810 [Verrucomicrobia bacterium]|nr:hypothetical protein [Verrucomicrobiota bacterium]